MSSTVLSAADIAKSLKAHVVPATVVTVASKPSTKVSKTTKRKSRQVIPPCQFCTRSDFKSVGNVKRHEEECILNPQRLLPSVKPCAKCGVEIATKSLKNHEAHCDGNDANTLERIATHEDLAMRKAIALRDGKPFISKRDLKKKVRKVTKAARKATAPIIPAPVKPKTVQNSYSDYTDIIDIMRQRLQNSDVSMKDFSAWAEITKILWEKV